MPIWLGFGSLSVDLLIAVVATSVLRHKMSHRPWRIIHVMAYGAWAFGLLHGLQIGTDAPSSWGAAFNYGCIALVLVAVIARVGLLAQPKVVTP
jgi:sulfoxide reductase heme-binding subunit YedZ